MKYLSITFFVLLTFSCNSSTKDLENFDEGAWQDDRNGCQGVRHEMVRQLEMSKEQLKGLSQNEITDLLGKPDRHELYKRSQKFFYYQITPHNSCNEPFDDDVYLSIRFNATGLAKEVQIMNFQALN